MCMHCVCVCVSINVKNPSWIDHETSANQKLIMIVACGVNVNHKAMAITGAS